MGLVVRWYQVIAGADGERCLGVPIEGSIRCLCWAWRSVCLPPRQSAFYGVDGAFNATGAAVILVLLPLQVLFGGSTPHESVTAVLPRTIMLTAVVTLLALA